jgi:4-hydroxybenzoate polyprenyltransferase
MLLAILKTMRPAQWTKNAFVLAALIFDRQLTNPTAVLNSLLGVFLFCLLSSCVYIINDIVDVDADRQHPKKRKRPIAAGTLPVSVAIVVTILIFAFTITASFILSPGFALIALTYFVLNLAYSLRLKHIPILDVLIVAAGFVLRVAAGVSLIQVERFSPWLYVVTTLLALFLGFGKRRAELTLLQHRADLHRPVLDGYTVPFLDHLITVVSGTTILSYSLYTFSAPNLPENHAMMLTIPFVLYGIFRYLYLIHVKEEGGAPDDLLLTDRPLQVTIGLYGLTVLSIFYFF